MSQSSDSVTIWRCFWWRGVPVSTPGQGKGYLAWLGPGSVSLHPIPPWLVRPQYAPNSFPNTAGQHLTEGSGKPTVSVACSWICCLPFVAGTHTQSAQPLIPACREPGCTRKAWGLTFRAALWTDNKSGPEGGLGALLRTDFPPSCGSSP